MQSFNALAMQAAAHEALPYTASLILLVATAAPVGTGDLAPTAACPPSPSVSAPVDRPSVDQVLSQVEAKYKQNEKKYETLADEVEKEVRKALKSSVWLTQQEAGTARTLAEHPYFALVEQLSKAAQAEASKPDPKRKATHDALLAKFPWIPRVELDIGLDGGSDRPVPTNEKGFIALGRVSDPVPGFPELLTNQYLYGLQEIVSWHVGVKTGKKISFDGRDPKKPLVLETSLPGWEKLRVLLNGSLPEVPLLAMPWLTHAIHSRLVERRRSASGELARMDEELAFLDSKWDGFTFEVPYTKERLVVVEPIHALMTDRRGFFYRFKDSEHMAQVGDLPFVCIPTYQQYAKAFLGQQIPGSDFIHNSAAGKSAGESLQGDCAYLARYKCLVDQFVRAILCPSLRYPEYLGILDYPKDRMPDERKVDGQFDVTRKHAILVWAFVGKDPVKLADFLFDNVLDKEANRFPQNVTLAAAFTTAVREKEQEMIKAVAARIKGDGKAATPEAATPRIPDEFEREFSPFSAYLDSKGDPSSDFLLNSFHTFHERATKLIQDTALAVVQKEIGK